MSTNIEKQLRRACKSSGRSINELAAASGLCYASTYSFMKLGKSLSLTSAARLAAELGLTLSKAKPRRRKGGA